MKANPEYRLQLYALLYAAPPCARIRPGQSRLRMLAAGSGDVCLETFRALFWCAQTEGVLSGVLTVLVWLICFGANLWNAMDYIRASGLM